MICPPGKASNCPGGKATLSAGLPYEATGKELKDAPSGPKEAVPAHDETYCSICGAIKQ